MAQALIDGKLSPALTDEEVLRFRQRKFGTVTGWVFDLPDSVAVQVWLDRYCSANPLDLVKQAAGELADELEGPKKPTPAGKPKRK